jgi:hypothetical protein
MFYSILFNLSQSVKSVAIFIRQIHPNLKKQFTPKGSQFDKSSEGHLTVEGI